MENNANDNESIVSDGSSTITVNGSNGSINMISTSTFNFDGYGEKELVGVNVKEETIEILYKRRSTIHYTSGSFVGLNSYGVVTNSQPPDQAIKEIYGVKKGKLTLLKTLIGIVVSSYVVPESLQFNEDE